MSYIVPADIPMYCNKCPFGKWQFDSLIDNYYGYWCSAKFTKYVPDEMHKRDSKGKYINIVTGKRNTNLSKPDWCPLVEVLNDSRRNE